VVDHRAVSMVRSLFVRVRSQPNSHFGFRSIEPIPSTAHHLKALLARHANAKVTAQIYSGVSEDAKAKTATKLTSAGFGS
jgi:hypothetical protein